MGPTVCDSDLVEAPQISNTGWETKNNNNLIVAYVTSIKETYLYKIIK